jgi:membrane protein DedA with SNARE-associated domain
MTAFETQLIEVLQNIFDRFGWFGVAGVMAFENATSISPSEIFLSLAGWMLLGMKNSPEYMIFLGGFYAALGSSLGSSVTYWIIRLGGRPLIEDLARRVRVNPGYISLAEEQFRRWGSGIVLFGRILPWVRNLITIPAGLAKMPFLQFYIYTFIGTYIYCTLFIGVGYAVGHEWSQLREMINQAGPWLFALAIFLGGFVLLAHFWIQNRFRSQASIIPTDQEE